MAGQQAKGQVEWCPEPVEGHFLYNMKGKWTVYTLKCSDGSYYVGHTEDMKKRISIHNSGRGAAYTATHHPVVLAYHESAVDKPAAVKREKQIKRWSKTKKEALIRGNIELLKNLSRSRSANLRTE